MENVYSDNFIQVSPEDTAYLISLTEKEWKKVPGDGNCFMASCAEQMEGYSSRQIREEICDELTSWKQPEGWLPSDPACREAERDQSWADRTARMRVEGTYVEEFDIQVCFNSF